MGEAARGFCLEGKENWEIRAEEAEIKTIFLSLRSLLPLSAPLSRVQELWMARVLVGLQFNGLLKARHLITANLWLKPGNILNSEIFFCTPLRGLNNFSPPASGGVGCRTFFIIN